MAINALFQNCLTFEHLLSPHILSSYQIANVKKFTWMEWQEIDVVTNNFNLVKQPPVTKLGREKHEMAKMGFPCPI